MLLWIWISVLKGRTFRWVRMDGKKRNMSAVAFVPFQRYAHICSWKLVNQMDLLIQDPLLMWNFWQGDFSLNKNIKIFQVWKISLKCFRPEDYFKLFFFCFCFFNFFWICGVSTFFFFCCCSSVLCTHLRGTAMSPCRMGPLLFEDYTLGVQVPTFTVLAYFWLGGHMSSVNLNNCTKM